MYKVFASFTVDARKQALALFAKHDSSDPDRYVEIDQSGSYRQCCPIGACFWFDEEAPSVGTYMPSASLVADAVVDQYERREHRGALASAAAFIGKWDSGLILTIDELRAAMGLDQEGV